MDKKEIRKQIKQTLASTKSTFSQEASRICGQIISSAEYKKADTILAYMALSDEVDLSAVVSKALKDGKTVYLPHVYPETSKMDFYIFTNETPVVTGEFGIKEPVFSTSNAKFSEINENTLMLIPGRAFTKNGDRLGRGKGFYDIYLEPLKNNALLKKAGVCFPCQILPELPADTTDVKMDLLFY